MMRLFIVLLCLFGQVATAEVISVRSGDHVGFTRLVLAIPVGRNWRIGRQGAGYDVETGAATDSFDLAAAFEKIQRTRVAALVPTATPGRLRIELVCECHVQAFLWQPDRVVIDIVDGPAPVDALYEQTLDLPNVAPTPEVKTTVAVLPLTFTLPGPTAVHLIRLMAERADGPVQEPAGDTAASAQISATEQAIIESFARAASQGVLDVAAAPPQAMQAHAQAAPADHLDMAATAAGTAPDHAGSPASALAEFEITAPAESRPGITAQTSVDRGQTLGEAPELGTSEAGTCLDDALVDLEHWGDARDFPVQIAERISGLTIEFDAYPEGAVEALARTYIYFGFGREAVQTLALDQTDSQQRRVLVALAHIVDQEPDPARLFAGQLGCATQSALWTALSRGTFEGTNESERNAAKSGFRALPPMLRGHLGAQLAQLFVDFGDPGVAETILAAARGEATAARVETALTAADIMLETAGADAAIAALTEMATGDARLTPDALVQLIDLSLSQQQDVPPDMIALAGTMQYEYRGQPVAAALIDAQARALIAGDAFAAAFTLLDGPVEPLGMDDLARLRSAAILALTLRASDPAFLNFAFDDLPVTDNPLVENAVATRLVALGFADRAAALLTSPATGAAARDRRYLQAEIALQLGDAASVEGYLGGMTDPRAARLRAAALAASGDFAAAASAGQIVPGSPPDPAGAWRAGDWAGLEHSDDPLLRAAADAIRADPAALDPSTPLAASRELLDQATQTRDLASQLLERFAVDPAAPAPGTN